jgi:hypothetical protein
LRVYTIFGHTAEAKRNSRNRSAGEMGAAMGILDVRWLLEGYPELLFGKSIGGDTIRVK